MKVYSLEIQMNINYAQLELQLKQEFAEKKIDVW